MKLIRYRFVILFVVWLCLAIGCDVVAIKLAKNRGVSEYDAKMIGRGVELAMWVVPIAILYVYGSRLGKYRREHGLCEQCGFDLKDVEGKCPRCGRSTALR